MQPRNGHAAERVNENIYQFQSGAIYNQNQVMLNYTVRAKRLSLFGFYMMNLRTRTHGRRLFPSQPVGSTRDYGRANFDVRNPLPAGENLQASLWSFVQPDAGHQFRAALQHYHRQDLNATTSSTTGRIGNRRQHENTRNQL